MTLKKDEAAQLMNRDWWMLTIAGCSPERVGYAIQNLALIDGFPDTPTPEQVVSATQEVMRAGGQGKADLWAYMCERIEVPKDDLPDQFLALCNALLYEGQQRNVRSTTTGQSFDFTDMEMWGNWVDAIMSTITNATGNRPSGGGAPAPTPVPDTTTTTEPAEKDNTAWIVGGTIAVLLLLGGLAAWWNASTQKPPKQ